jgi:hypothetical protein
MQVKGSRVRLCECHHAHAEWFGFSGLFFFGFPLLVYAFFISPIPSQYVNSQEFWIVFYIDIN